MHYGVKNIYDVSYLETVLKVEAAGADGVSRDHGEGDERGNARKQKETSHDQNFNK
jgi:hypothetical protein